MLGDRRPLDVGTAGTLQMGWLTDDLELEMEQLRARGVVFDRAEVPVVGPVDGGTGMSGAKAAWFRDTEGNLLCITQLSAIPTPGSKGKAARSRRLRDPIWNLGVPTELLTAIPAV